MYREVFFRLTELFFGDSDQYESSVWLRLVTLFGLVLTIAFSSSVTMTIFLIFGLGGRAYFWAYAVFFLIPLLVLITFRLHRSVRLFSIIFLSVVTLVPFALHFTGGGFIASQGDFLWIVAGLITVIMMFDLKIAGWYYFFIFGSLVVLSTAELSGRTYVRFAATLPDVFNLIINVLGIATCVFLSFLVYVPEIQGSLSRFQRLLDEVREANAELTRTLAELKGTQSRLVQSERLASLGQLIAGIAHEINTPISAMKSSASVMLAQMRDNLIPLLEACRALPDGEFSFLLHLVEVSITQPPPTTTEEARRRKRAVFDFLEKNGVPDAQGLAGLLAETNILEPDILESALPCLRGETGASVVRLAYQLTVMVIGTKNILTASEKAGKITFALKTFTYHDYTDRAVFCDITEGLETVLTLYYAQMKGSVELVRDYGDIPNLPIFPDELNQVWTNLIQNALQAMEGHGTMTLSARVNGDYVDVSVSDTGRGIPEDIIGKIFDPFFTTKPRGEGSGLGLDIAGRIVRKHRGHIHAVSEVGRGTTFTVSLPIREEDS